MLLYCFAELKVRVGQKALALAVSLRRFADSLQVCSCVHLDMYVLGLRDAYRSGEKLDR